MFTGLVEEVGKVVRVTRAGTGLEVVVEATRIGPQCRPGDSVAMNGICLTVAEMRGVQVKCHVGAETVQRTTAAQWRSGTRLNLERALAVGQRLGGHFVQGHVDGVGELIKRSAPAETIYFSFTLPADLRPMVVEKGSIAVDGVSLTVTEVTAGGFSVALIPFTLQNTNLADLRPGSPVNLEVDILGKYVYNMLSRGGQAPAAGISEGFLAEHGFC